MTSRWWLGLLLLAASLPAQDPIPLRIAVIAPVAEQARSMAWMQPFADHLGASIPNSRVSLVPLTADQLYVALREQTVDFAIPIRFHFVTMESCCGANVIATLRYPTSGEPTPFSSTGVVVRDNDQRYVRIQDVATARIGAVGRESFSGYLTVLYELRQLGADTAAMERQATFIPSEQKLLAGLEKGTLDAAFVTSFRLQTFDWKRHGLRLLPHDPARCLLHEHYPLAHSTDVYPGSPFVHFRHVSNAVATKVAVALLTMPTEPNTRIEQKAGWVIPLGYQNVHEVLRTLRLGPYKNFGIVTWRTVLQQHWLAATGAALTMVLLAAAAVFAWRSRRAHETARDRAIALAASKSQFLATMSHEIRTPLFGILGMSELAWREAPRGDTADSLGVIYRSSLSLMAVLNAILESAKIESGLLTVHGTTFDLRGLIEEVVEGLKPQAQMKQIAVTIDHPPGVAERITSDEGKLRQILFNLLGNAVKFTAQGGVVIRVRPGLAIEIVDTGIGIPAELQAKVFEPFEQATERFGGTGLGLSIARGLAQRLGGDLHLQSQPGEGSTFTLQFPETMIDAKLAPPEPVTKTNPEPAHLNGMRILVVDDNAVNRRVAERMLERLGCSVVVADGGEQAMNHFRPAKFDAVLLDCHMPGMDGFEVARRIRAQEQAGSRTPLLAFTASEQERERLLSREAGMDDLVPKPTSLESLRGALVRFHKAIPSSIKE